MIRKITLHNFMSHQHTEIELANGLTVLVGENNCGKSAIVEALYILCHNVGGGYMVRHGENECKVIVETEEGHVIEWKREKNSVSYTINGKPIHRLKGGVPDDLHKLLRISKVSTKDGNENFDIHFGEQKKPVFLLDGSGSQAAKFFASSSDAESLIKMQDLHKSNIRNANQTSNRLKKEIEERDLRIKSLDRVTILQTKLAEEKTQYETLMSNRQLANALERAIEELRKVTERKGVLDNQASVYKFLQKPPSMRDTKSLDVHLTDLETWLKQFSYFEHQVQAFDHLQSPPLLADTATLEILLRELAQVGHSVLHVSAVNRVLSNLDSPPIMLSHAELELAVNQMQEYVDSLQYQKRKSECYVQLSLPPLLSDTELLENMLSELERVHNQTNYNQEQTIALEACKAPPDLIDESIIVDLLYHLKLNSVNVSRHHSFYEELHNLQNPPHLADPQPLGLLITEYEMLGNKVTTLNEEFNQVKILMADAEKELRAWSAENPFCKTCGAEIDPNRLISMAVAGMGGHIHESH